MIRSFSADAVARGWVIPEQSKNTTGDPDSPLRVFFKGDGSYRRRLFLLWLSFGIILILTGVAVASEAELTDVIIGSSAGDLNLSLKIHGDFIKEIKMDALIKGIFFPITFTIALYQVRDYWFDKKIAEKTGVNSIYYDSLKQEISVKRSWDVKSPVVVWSMDEARQLISQINDLKVTPLSGLEKGRKYQLRARAVCQELSGLLSKPLRRYKTDWYAVDFMY